MTNATIITALAQAGLVGRSDWETPCGDTIMGAVDVMVGGRKIATIRNAGRAVVPVKVQVDHGHGLSRCSHHPLYPQPTSNPFIVKLLSVCEAANAGGTP